MANKNLSITIDARTAEGLFSEVEAIEKALAVLKKKIVKFLPAKYGSALWWEKSDEEAIKSMKKGKGIAFDDVNKALDYLHS